MQTYSEYYETMKAYGFYPVNEKTWQEWQVYYHSMYRGTTLFKDLRDDIQLETFALSLGFTIDKGRSPIKQRTHDNVIIEYGMEAHVFSINNTHIWFATYHGPQWRTAEIIDEHYCNHRTWPTLKWALIMESMNIKQGIW